MTLSEFVVDFTAENGFEPEDCKEVEPGVFQFGVKLCSAGEMGEALRQPARFQTPLANLSVPPNCQVLWIVPHLYLGGLMAIVCLRVPVPVLDEGLWTATAEDYPEEER